MATAALASCAWVGWRGLSRRADAHWLIPLSLFCASAVPLTAFYGGHPFRIRYMVPVVSASAMLAGVGVGALRSVHRRAPAVAGILLVGVTTYESPVWSQHAPMLLEAQLDRDASLGRQTVTACLSPQYRGEKILASMGSLAHYMQELSGSGFRIADFINEGNGSVWELALQTGPAPHAGWMLVEEVAEGGDVLAQHVREDPEYLRGMVRVCEGGGVALYRRDSVGQ
jgi:hypothetical protein